MKYQSRLTLFILLLISSVGFAVNKTSDFEIIRQRVVSTLMKRGTNDTEIERILKTFKPDSTWPGINYSDVSREGFEHRIHYSNMVELARALKNPQSKYYRNKKVKSTLIAATGFWVNHDFICDNWWYNQIGTPDNLVTVMLLAGDELPKEIVAKAQPIIGRAHLKASGARPSGDRIKIAGILAKNLLFTGDQKQFAEVVRVIEGEIKFSTGSRGMQHDYSFHHREDRVNNTTSYGTGYADAFAEWAAYVAGTEYAFIPEKINQLVDYYLDGICKQLVFGRTNDPGTRNRDISRESGREPWGTITPERLMMATGYRKTELEEIIKIRREEAKPTRSFDKFFWQTEHYVHQRPDYYTSVRMHSIRNRNMEEPYNSEGLMNHHRGDGTNYISGRGDEYFNMAPVYDWQKIPGATIMQKPELPPPSEIQKEGLSEFAGAVTDGKYGAVAFDFRSSHDPLFAKKAWFFFDREYVCLGAGIKCRADLPVVTTLNQCLLSGNVIVKAGEKKTQVEKGEHRFADVKWIFHDGVGYLFPDPVAVNLMNSSAKGSWYAINHQSDSPKEEISLDVFKLWMDHGKRPSQASYQYIVVPATTEAGLNETAIQSPVRILANTPRIQAVLHTGLNIFQAVFYSAGEIQVTGYLRIGLCSPGMVQIKYNKEEINEISLADPSRTLSKIILKISGKINPPNDNARMFWNPEKNQTELTVELPQNEYSGKSVTIRL